MQVACQKGQVAAAAKLLLRLQQDCSEISDLLKGCIHQILWLCIERLRRYCCLIRCLRLLEAGPDNILRSLQRPHAPDETQHTWTKACNKKRGLPHARLEGSQSSGVPPMDPLSAREAHCSCRHAAGVNDPSEHAFRRCLACNAWPCASESPALPATAAALVLLGLESDAPSHCQSHPADSSWSTPPQPGAGSCKRTWGSIPVADHSSSVCRMACFPTPAASRRDMKAVCGWSMLGAFRSKEHEGLVQTRHDVMTDTFRSDPCTDQLGHRSAASWHVYDCEIDPNTLILEVCPTTARWCK